MATLLYKEPNFSGKSLRLEVGNYSHTYLRDVQWDTFEEAQSIKVPRNTIVQLSESSHPGNAGTTQVIIGPSDVAAVPIKIRSLKIRHFASDSYVSGVRATLHENVGYGGRFFNMLEGTYNMARLSAGENNGDRITRIGGLAVEPGALVVITRSDGRSFFVEGPERVDLAALSYDETNIVDFIVMKIRSDSRRAPPNPHQYAPAATYGERDLWAETREAIAGRVSGYPVKHNPIEYNPVNNYAAAVAEMDMLNTMKLREDYSSRKENKISTKDIENAYAKKLCNEEKSNCAWDYRWLVIMLILFIILAIFVGMMFIIKKAINKAGYDIKQPELIRKTCFLGPVCREKTLYRDGSKSERFIIISKNRKQINLPAHKGSAYTRISKPESNTESNAAPINKGV